MKDEDGRNLLGENELRYFFLRANGILIFRMFLKYIIFKQINVSENVKKLTIILLFIIYFSVTLRSLRSSYSYPSYERF